ncbi:TPA: 3-hydroxyacyl-[acyl-carrier-protein] dehydratase FabZ, partial [Legionella pneumophila]
MNESIDINQIFTLLPHRYPFILVDRVIDYKVMEYLI